MVKLFTFKNGAYNRVKDGLFGKERDVLESLFIDDKTPKTFDKLTGLQKKVIRKMGWDKIHFLTSIDLTKSKK